MKKRFFNKQVSLKTYLSVVFIASLLFCMLGLWILPMYRYYGLFKSQTESFCLKIISQSSNNILSELGDFESTVRSILNDMEFNELLHADTINDYDNQFFANIVRRHFIPGTLDYHYLEAIELFIKESEVRYAYGNYGTGIHQPFNSNHFIMALETPLSFRWMGFNPNTNAIEVSKIIYDDISHEILSFMVIYLSPNFLLNEFTRIDGLEFKNMYIIDERGVILFSIDYRYMNTVLCEKDLENLSGFSGAFEADGTTFIFRRLTGLMTRPPYNNWTIIVELDDAILYRDLNTMLFVTSIIALGVGVVGIIFVILLVNMLAKPVKRIVDGFQRIQNEDFSTEIDVSTGINEINMITNGYNEAVRHLNTLINTVYREQLSLNEMRFKSLQARIRPHFLFNTLQLISLKSQKYQVFEIRDMIQSLSYMLEHDLSNKNKLGKF